MPPSTTRSGFLKQRYLNAPLMVDIEYIRNLTVSHRQTGGMEIQERRALNHAHALENLTPVIHPGDRLAGNKTRYIRGAVPYANYASEPFLREMRRQEQDAQARHAETGSGGGIARGLEEASVSGMEVISGKFLISRDDLTEFREICEYWEGKSFMDLGNGNWKTGFEHAEFIENGWKIGLYTAPHEPCPEGRLILDFDMALSKGYLAIIHEIEERIENSRKTPAEEQRLSFWHAALTVLNGSIRFARNYAGEAIRLASQEPNPDRVSELLELAEICNRVPMEPPRNFREAVQSFWFTYLLGHLEGSHLGYSPGKLDQVLYPWYQADPGTCFEEAVELFEELFVKMTQIEYIASLSWQGLGHGNLYQNLILGGVDENDEPCSNELSKAILQAQINMQLTQPTLSVWYDDRLDPDFLMKATECVKTGVGYPAFFNQKTYIRHESETSGLPLGTIRRCSAMGGCTEPTLQGMSYGIVQAGFINHGKLIDLVMNGGTDPVTGIRMFPERAADDFDSIRRYYLDMMQSAVRNWQQYWNLAMIAHRETVPLIFCSVFVRDCLTRGKNMDDGGAILNQSVTTLSSGLVNVANSLAVIRKLCFDDRVCTFAELTAAIHDNWAGHAALRKKALEVPHWGNDDDYVDSIFIDLYDEYCDWVKQQDNYLGFPYDPSMLAISTPVPFGKVCGAFPDGRLRGEPLADGVTSPYPGTDTLGPTAVIRSSAKVDHTRIRGGLLNLKFHPSALEGENGSRNLLALIKTYFEKPGFHVQFNVVDSNMLRDAQKHPENYRNLVVRVAGFSAYWVEMSQALQDQVICRTEHNL